MQGCGWGGGLRVRGAALPQALQAGGDGGGHGGGVPGGEHGEVPAADGGIRHRDLQLPVLPVGDEVAGRLGGGEGEHGVWVGTATARGGGANGLIRSFVCDSHWLSSQIVDVQHEIGPLKTTLRGVSDAVTGTHLI